VVSVVEDEVVVVLDLKGIWGATLAVGARGPESVVTVEVHGMVDNEVTIGLNSGVVLTII
jgi:hypothetical protein